MLRYPDKVYDNLRYSAEQLANAEYVDNLGYDSWILLLIEGRLAVVANIDYANVMEEMSSNVKLY